MIVPSQDHLGEREKVSCYRTNVPSNYVGAEAVENDGEPFHEKMAKLTTTFKEQFSESARLEREIRKNLDALGFKF